MISRYALALPLCAAMLGASGAARAADAPAPRTEGPDERNVILARTRPDVMLVWKTNDAVAALVDAQVAGDRLYGAILARAERIMTEHVRDARRGGTIAIRLIYVRDAMDPHYEIRTVSGIDSLGTLSASADALRSNGGRWAAALTAGTTPPGLANDVGRGWTTDVEPK